MPIFSQACFLAVLLYPASSGCPVLGVKDIPFNCCRGWQWFLKNDTKFLSINHVLWRASKEHWQLQTHKAICMGMCKCTWLCVGLAECGVPVNKFIWEIYLQKTDFTCILGYSLLYFSASLLFSFTFPPRIPILPLNLKTCASHYLLMAFCDLCFCSCLSFSSSSLPRDPLSP